MEEKNKLTDRKISQISLAISIIAILISLFTTIYPLTARPNINLNVASTFKFSQEYGTLTPVVFLDFFNEGREIGRIDRITCTVLSKNKKFVKNYYAKYVKDLYSGKFPFQPATIVPGFGVGFPAIFYPSLDDVIQKDIVRINSLRYDDFLKQKKDTPKIMNTFDITLSDSIFKKVKEFSLSNMADFNIGEYYMIISIYTDKLSNIPSRQDVFSFTLQQYILEELEKNIDNYKFSADLSEVKSFTLNFSISSDISLSKVAASEKKEILKDIIK